jgi:hypothetical protein
MTKIRDYKVKPLLKYYRPYFSPHTDSYEIDYVFGGKVMTKDVESGLSKLENRNYFFCININTKYLFVVPLPMGENRRLTYTLLSISQI